MHNNDWQRYEEYRQSLETITGHTWTLNTGGDISAKSGNYSIVLRWGRGVWDCKLHWFDRDRPGLRIGVGDTPTEALICAREILGPMLGVGQVPVAENSDLSP
jgi:hypothetical protein